MGGTCGSHSQRDLGMLGGEGGKRGVRSTQILLSIKVNS